MFPKYLQKYVFFGVWWKIVTVCNWFECIIYKLSVSMIIWNLIWTECFFKIMLFLKNVQYDYMSTTCAHLILEFRVKGQLNAQIFLEHLRITPTPKCLKRKLSYKEASRQKRNKDERRRQIKACYDNRCKNRLNQLCTFAILNVLKGHQPLCQLLTK